MGILKKLLKDLLQNPKTGIYSRKSVSWMTVNLLTVIIVIRGMWANIWPPDYIWWGLLLIGGFLASATLFDKKYKNGNTKEQD